VTNLDISSLPTEYQYLIHLAQERHGIEVVLLEELRGGRTGALLYLVSVNRQDSFPIQHFVLKLDRINPQSKFDEVTRHTLARGQAPANFARDHMAELVLDVEKDGCIAVFYTIAGQSLHQFRPLAYYERQSSLESIFYATSDKLLTGWNAQLTFEQAVHPQNILNRWLGYRLRSEGNIGRFLEDHFHINQDTQGFLIQNQVFPNPLIYGRKIEIWGQSRPIDISIGFQHGDLNIGNILVKFAENEKDLEGYFLIDFALFKHQMPLFYDQRYLEMSYLMRELGRTPFAKWVTWITQFSLQDMPDPDKVPVEFSGAGSVINAGRNAFAQWVKDFHASLNDDLWGQLWLAGVAVGLNYCNKTGLSVKERLAALIYAAAHLKRFCTQFRVPAPLEVSLLFDADTWQEEDLAVKGPASLPTGTVTFLFTDIVASTSLWEAYPQEMDAALTRHDSILEKSFFAHHGFIVKRTGDGFHVVFKDAKDALMSAVKVQRALKSEPWGKTGPLQVRMGLHTGTAELRDGDYFSPEVNRAARLQGVAHGGQILFSQATLEVVCDQLPPEITWLDLGQHWLRDIKQTEHIYQVIVADLPAEFPILPTVSLQERAIPEYAKPLVGRQSELAQIVQLLDINHLITLSGPGGIGKTRLAMAIVESQASNYRESAHFVPLLSLNSPTAIAPAIANVLGLTFLEGRAPQDQLLDYLRTRQMLLVLDNMEHLLIDDKAEETLALVEAMLTSAKDLTILATSRELLRLPIEKAYQVQGLPVGDKETEINEQSATELFCLRAHDVLPSIDIESVETLRYIHQVCRLVEGMPLAIELAAAQLRLITPAELATEITAGLDVLDSGMRGVGARHHSMRVVFETSWRNLDPRMQLILARLAVFQGGFTPQAASQVTQATVPELATLLDKSLLQRNADGRFGFHALIQMFAHEKLLEMTPELDPALERHYQYYRQMLRTIVSHWQETYDNAALNPIGLEVDNLRAGWKWIVSQSNWDEVAAYLDDLWQFFKVRGRLPEAMELINQALNAGQTAQRAASNVHQAHWERRLGQAYLWLSQLIEGEEHYRCAISLLEWPLPESQAGLLLGLIQQLFIQLLHRAWPGHFVGYLEVKQAGLQEAFYSYERLAERAFLENKTLLGTYCGFRSLNLAEAAGINSLMARAYASTGYALGLMRLRKLAEAYLSWAETIIQHDPAIDTQEIVIRVLGYYYIGTGDFMRARELFIHAARLAGELGQNWVQELSWTALLVIALWKGELEHSLEYARRIGISSHRRGDAGFEAAALYWEALIKLQQDKMNEVFGLLEKSASAPSEVMMSLDWIILRAVLAKAHFHQDQLQSATNEANEVLKLISEISYPSSCIYLCGYSGIAEVYLALWEAQSSDKTNRGIQASAQHACKNLQGFGKVFPVAKPLVWLYQGLYDWLAGNPRKAYKDWQKSLNYAQEMENPYQQGLAHYEIGRHLKVGEKSENGWGPQEHLQHAIEIFADLGAAYDLNRANRELNKLETTS
jgi:predicted ATPase/class 3 adenylate cyclase